VPIAVFGKQESGSVCRLFSGLKITLQFSPKRNLTCKHPANSLFGKPEIGLKNPFYVKISMVKKSRTLPIRTEIVTFTRFRAGSLHKLPAFAAMPTQRESCVTADEGRCRRLLLAAAVWVCLGVEQQTICSSACLVLWLRRRRKLRRVRSLCVRMLSRTFTLAHMSAYDVVSQMQFSKRDNTTLASRMPWRETTLLGQLRTARRR
jgi:hypothetical protein